MFSFYWKGGLAEKHNFKFQASDHRYISEGIFQ